MNYFAHGRLFLDDPYFLAGTAVPDWLNVSDRRVRVRSKHAVGFTGDGDDPCRQLACGILRHHADDGWFHETSAFHELNWQFVAELRPLLPQDEGFRPSFLAHIAVELLLDADLIAANPGALEAYYQALAHVDPALVEELVNRFQSQTCQRLAQFIPLFRQDRFLWDYLDDGKLWWRLNRVMQRVGLPPLPESVAEWLGSARRAVAARRQDLLTPPA